ncbi:MAG: hypothetical protein AAF432_12645, partial [Planctomycetota bacterium]
MQRIIEDLNRIRQRSRLMLFAQGMAIALSWLLAIGLIVILADYLLRFPSAFRMVVLIGGLVALGWWITTTLRAAFAFAPSLTELALRVERKIPSVTGRLASSVEFAMAGLDRDNPLAARSVRDAESRMSGQRIASVIDPRLMWRRIGISAAIIALAATCAIVSPTGAATGIKRLLVPYGSMQWPARTAVESLMTEVLRDGAVHPRGQALPLRARNLTVNGEDEDVKAFYRMQRDDAWGDWMRIVLTHQGDGIHERLVDTEADAIEVRFATADAETTIEEIALVPPPSVIRSSIVISPPSYASGRVPGLDAELGPGIDDRATTPDAMLIGSTVQFTLELNKELPVPAAGDARDAWLTEQTFLGFDDVVPTLQVGPDGTPSTVWLLTWTLPDTQTLRVTLTDEYGLTNDETISYRIQAVDDIIPTVTITDPEADGIVLPTAVIPVTADARDDVALAELWVEARVQSANDAEPTDEPAWIATESVDAIDATMTNELALGALNVGEGDVISIQGKATDIYVVDEQRHPVATSPIRRLRVISEVDFATQMRRQLSGVRQNAIRIEALQSELQDDVIENGVQPGISRAQGELAERLADQRTALDDITRQLDVNRLDDEQLRTLLDQSGNLLDFAGRAAEQATRAVEERERAIADDPEAAERSAERQSGSQSQQGEQSQSGSQSQQGEQSQSGSQSQQGEQSQSGSQSQQGEQSQSGSQSQQGE